MSGQPISQVAEDLFRVVDANGSDALEYGELAEWWHQQGGNPTELEKLEAAFRIALEQASVVDLRVFSHVMVAVATEGWTEETSASGRVEYHNSETGEIKVTCPGARWRLS